eukprot:NODE_403_length_1543_cov_95.221045_g371_i0.p1 GENE.NODE_403_length_1543_cov_95.221045_g371_i0~~NODE_403_length_1543_cov_95.221045_g371_i0.p1  ORF type:complete len:402 (+),score=55.37 NODE_403_length_1543_cov_95.221045_g371_i0:82-1287(+)
MTTMDVDDGAETITVLCCVCGISIEPNPSNMCIQCIQSQINITKDIVTQSTVQFCPQCERYLSPPRYWVQADLESRELLELCLRRIKGLNSVKLVDASWIWTEPHSKRLKIKLTVQQELFSNTSVQQTCVVEFVVASMMCETCQKVNTGQEVWTAVVQARQKADHKKTFLALEQLIIKKGLHEEAIRVQEQPDGIDFFYAHKSHALRMVDFLGGVCPTRWKGAEQLVSHDPKNNTAAVHHTFSVDIAPICKNDLVLLPKPLYNSYGGLGPVVLCNKVNTGIILMDPTNLRTAIIPAALYWKQPFDAWATGRNQIEFYVVDVDLKEDVYKGKYVMAEVEVQKGDEVGSGKTYFTKTHLGRLLEPGDSVMGYLLPELNLNESVANEYKRMEVPDVYLTHRIKS